MTPQKSLNFILIPAQSNRYDRRVMRDLANALIAFGHKATSLLGPVPGSALVSLCKQTDVDVVIQVNKSRPRKGKLPNGIRHITWFQDVFPSDQKEFTAFEPNDIVYFLGDPVVLGLNQDLPCLVSTLVTGVDEALLARHERVDFACDFSLCGFIPLPSDLRTRGWLRLYFTVPMLAGLAGLLSAGLANDLVLLLGRRDAPEPVAAVLRALVEANYEPLTGSLDINRIGCALREALSDLRGHYGISTQGARHLIDYYAREYPRLMDRLLLAHTITDISNSVHLYGPGWNLHGEFQKFHHGTLNSQLELAQVYRTSRINLSNNTHGLGLHSRNLECMAAGGFVLTHTSPNDDKPGGMLTTFEPGLHYATFMPQTLAEEAQRWLRNEQTRLAAVKRARDVVREKHLWRHRAEQILVDLNR